VRNVPSLTHLLTGSDQFGFFENWSGWRRLLGFASLGYILIGIPISQRNRNSGL
jgi:hypothetical protein